MDEHIAMMPVAAHEADMVRAEKMEKRQWIVIILLILLLVGSNVAWMVYEAQFETVTTSESYEADAGEGGNAIINGAGSVNVNGESESN